MYTAGSNFFNLQSEKSDLDFKGIYLPSPEKFYNNKQLDKVFNYSSGSYDSKNTNEDVDLSLISLPFFFKLLAKGDFNMIELLHTPKDKIIKKSNLMDEILEKKNLLILKNVKTFIGFFNREYIKYAFNVKHHKHRVDFVKFLKTLDQSKGRRLDSHWNLIKKYASNKENGLELIKTKTGTFVEHPTINIGNRMFQWRSPIDYVIRELNKFIKNAGNRQKNIVENGRDLKGLYHCLRLLYEGEDLLTKGELEIPFNRERHKVLKEIKNNNMEEKEVVKIVENQLQKVNDLEMTVLTNQALIDYRTEKILNNLEAKMKIIYCLNKGETK